jgi:type IV pilus assembly protein PilN
MPRINLLPWREEERQRRQRDFGMAMGGAVLAAVAVVMLTMLAYSQMVSGQERRNARLTEEINELQRSIEEIDGLERQKERLLARMEIIDELQKSRPEVVHLFDEMVRQLPEGVYLTSFRQNGSRLEIRGVAQSSTRVSALMRQIDASNWLTDPEVERVQTTTSGTSRQAEFVVYAKQRSPGADMEDGV